MSPASGAHEVYGAIGDLWRSLGAEGGALGYPVTGELPDAFGRRQRFQRGAIEWSPFGSAHVVPVGTPDLADAILPPFRASSAGTPWTGLSRALVADRLAELVADPDLIAQRSLNVCGPVSPPGPGKIRVPGKR